MTPYIVTNSWGESTITLEFPNMPVLVKGGSEDFVFKKTFQVPLGKTFKIQKIRRFIATERGDLGEFDIEVFSDGLSVYRESFHKEMPVSYQAWDEEAITVTSSELVVKLVARVTAANILLSDEEITKGRAGNRLTAVVHFGVILSGKVA